MNYIRIRIILKSMVFLTISTHSMHRSFKFQLVNRSSPLRFAHSPIHKRIQITRHLNNRRCTPSISVNHTMVHRYLGICYRLCPTFLLIRPSIRWIFGHVEMHLRFSIQLSPIYTFLACTYVNVLVFKVQTSYMVDLPLQCLITRIVTDPSR